MTLERLKCDLLSLIFIIYSWITNKNLNSPLVGTCQRKNQGGENKIVGVHATWIWQVLLKLWNSWLPKHSWSLSEILNKNLDMCFVKGNTFSFVLNTESKETKVWKKLWYMYVAWVGTFRWPPVHGPPQWTTKMDYPYGLSNGLPRWTT